MKIKIEKFKESVLKHQELFPILGGSNATKSGSTVTRTATADQDENGNDYDR